MSGLRGRVGSIELAWRKPLRGSAGVGQVEVRDGAKTEVIEVRWRRQRRTLWLELPGRLVGFDFEAEQGDDGRVSYRVSERGTDREFAASFQGAGEQSAASSSAGRKTSVRVRAQMPGKIVRVLVTAGAVVAKDQPLVVMEAMKMENEIRAVGAGRVKEVKITEGQAVESGADLLTLDPV